MSIKSRLVTKLLKTHNESLERGHGLFKTVEKTSNTIEFFVNMRPSAHGTWRVDAEMCVRDQCAAGEGEVAKHLRPKYRPHNPTRR